ncbi:MAG: 23S rRNA (guanosine(2251)-2'-O)-methyltransferase RlmB [Candidatus Handelsmanbacteria bacterium]|nr:23S rRNA (guanosine(2251)-2'-O)-methyltransferase RlmB [Candidatus Handelsmanbacteria bacterium]
MIWGRRPVLEALKAGRPCQRLLVAQGSHGPAIDEIFALAKEAGVPFDMQDRLLLDRAAGPQHQGVIAYLAARAYASYEEVLIRLDPRVPFLVFLDGIKDPHNLGAIIRSACAVGADAVVIQERGAAGLTGAAARASAGAVEHLPVCRVNNLGRALALAREAGLWITGLAPDGKHPFTAVDYRGPCALVVGSEGTGMRRLVREGCDFVVQIPMGRAQLGSFNASVAAGLVLYEVFRQRHSPRS